jgi:hypothetical protein
MITDGWCWTDGWGVKDSTGPLVRSPDRWPKTRADPTGRWIGVNQDGKAWELPESRFGDINYDTNEDETRLYADNNIGTLADAVFHYWATDLDTTASNNVPPIITETSATSAIAEFLEPSQ